jgi:small subunit ribosomal protein S18
MTNESNGERRGVSPPVELQGDVDLLGHRRACSGRSPGLARRGHDWPLPGRVQQDGSLSPKPIALSALVPVEGKLSWPILDVIHSSCILCLLCAWATLRELSSFPAPLPDLAWGVDLRKITGSEKPKRARRSVFSNTIGTKQLLMSMMPGGRSSTRPKTKKRSKTRIKAKKKDPLFIEGKRPRPMYVDYKDVELLKKLINRHGRIVGRRKTGCCAISQRAVTQAIKRARFMALLPYTGE